MTASSPDPTPRSARPRFKWLLIVLALAAVVGVGVHWITAINDNSVQNGVSLGAIGVAVIAMLVWLYRAVSLWMSRRIAILAVVTVLLIPAVFFRLRGFTGEILPVIELRFARSQPLQQEVTAADRAEAPTHVATTEFSQFLGNDRTGVIAKREFEVPASADFAPLWTQGIGEGWAGFAIVGDRCVTLEQRDQKECVSCYRLSDGALLWIHQSPVRHENRVGGIGPRSTPTIAGNRVYTQGATGMVLCLDLSNGQEIWRQDLLALAGWSQAQSEHEINWGRAGSPLLVDDLCVVPFGGPDGDTSWPASAGQLEEQRNRGLIAFDQSSGAIRWTAGDDQISFASPMLMNLAGTEQIVIVNERSVTGHAIDDGRQLWRGAWRGRSNGAANCASALPVDANAFLVGKAYGTGSCVFEVVPEGEGFAVRERWARSNVLKTKFTHACIAGGFAYGLSDGLLECVDITTGKRVWAQPRSDRYGHGQVILVEDVLVVQTEAGEVAFVAAHSDGFKELAKLPALAGKSWNVPSIAGRYLAVRNDSQAIVYQLPPRQDTSLPSESDGPTESAEVATHAVTPARDALVSANAAAKL